VVEVGAMGLIGWWSGLPWWLRVGVACFFLLVSTGLWLADTFWPWGWGIGIVLLIFSFPSKSERKGYHDF
jgi:hypothetical protein